MNRAERGELRIYASPADLAAALADLFVAEARAAITAHGAFFTALAGGATPRAAYDLLAAPPRSDAIDWEHVRIFFGDERCVPPESDESNYRMAQEHLLGKVPIPQRYVHRMRGEADPGQAAHEYAELLVETMGDRPRFDLLLLGMGTDGHTASLFPGADPTADDERLVRAPFVEQMHAYRLTLTPLVINSARRIAIAAEGLTKAPALHAVREGPYDPTLHPIQIVAPQDGRLTWLVDRAAAAELAPSV